jgi:hypothetical protein
LDFSPISRRSLRRESLQNKFAQQVVRYRMSRGVPRVVFVVEPPSLRTNEV